MYLFGGRDEDNAKLNDLWRFDIATNVWQEVKPSDGKYPLERSGHAADIYEGQYMIVFGGIYEITKELNDLHIFDFGKRKWITVFEESYSPVRGGVGGAGRDVSPNQYDDAFQLTNNLNGSGSQGSPITGKNKSFMSPMKGKSSLNLA